MKEGPGRDTPGGLALRQEVDAPLALRPSLRGWCPEDRRARQRGVKGRGVRDCGRREGRGKVRTDREREEKVKDSGFFGVLNLERGLPRGHPSSSYRAMSYVSGLSEGGAPDPRREPSPFCERSIRSPEPCLCRGRVLCRRSTQTNTGRGDKHRSRLPGLSMGLV